ncbi:MAG: CDP-alcohol phosphatidyltransferase family protein, partial [Actinobacteria bacterium]|nr:CDP-alcohol phosphatidyltransferase family protein [Actinomycetota bacterium]
ILDPVADRIMIGSAVIAGLIAGVLPVVIAVPLMIREVIMAVVSLLLAARGAGALQVRYPGKVATFILYGAIPSFYLAAAGLFEGLLLSLGWGTGLIGLVLYWVALVQYLEDARLALKEVESPSAP